MYRRATLAALAFVFVFPLSSRALAGEARPGVREVQHVIIVKKDGAVVEGRLVEFTGGVYLVETGGKTVRVPASEVASVSVESAAEKPAAPAPLPEPAEAVALVIDARAGPGGFGFQGSGGEAPAAHLAAYLRNAACQVREVVIEVKAASSEFDGAELLFKWKPEEQVWKARINQELSLESGSDTLEGCAARLQENTAQEKTVMGLLQAAADEALLDIDPAAPFSVVSELLQALRSKSFRVFLFQADPDLSAACEPVFTCSGREYRLPSARLRLSVSPGTAFRRVLEALFACCCVGIRQVELVDESGAAVQVRLPVGAVSDSGYFLPGRTLGLSSVQGLLVKKAELEKSVGLLLSGDPGAASEARRRLIEAGIEALPFLEAVAGAGKAAEQDVLWLRSYLSLRHSKPEEQKGEEWYFADRWGGRRNLRAYGGGRHTESAALMGLIWLKNHQDEGGSWSCLRFMQNCRKGACSGPGSTDSYDTGLTGLALLAFLAGGHTQYEGKFCPVVDRGLRNLLDRQAADGGLGPRAEDGRWSYNHAMGTAALAEAYAMSFHDPRLKAPAQRAVDFLLSCQNPGKGWRYGVQPGQNDTSCTAWAASTLKIAKMSGLAVPDHAFEGALSWFDSVTDEVYYKAGYTSRSDSGSRLKEALGKFEPLEAMTAAAVFNRILLQGSRALKSPACLGGGNLIKQSPPRWDVKAGTIDMYYWYFGTLTMFQLGQNYWKAWNEPVKNALVPTQKREGCENGSWDPCGAWGPAGGRVYATAINVLSLEIYYRYRRVAEKN